MSRYFLILAGVSLLAIGAYRLHESPVADQPVPIQRHTTTATELLDAYQDNPQAADQRYNGEPLVVAGVVDHVMPDLLGGYTLALRSGSIISLVSADTGSIPLAGIRPGTMVTVECNQVNYAVMVLLTDCSRVERFSQQAPSADDASL